eukprot:TRINITY_DN6015_c0_g3_i1.p1 TRINITY_DN6015_c0_g3~~TRINITY_DN6015_c0_g3_i1.p1  ORF type:complete len:330 (+),score=70.22 TRINITY_DN6015_c0_g3_i1:279-1268(+)
MLLFSLFILSEDKQKDMSLVLQGVPADVVMWCVVSTAVSVAAGSFIQHTPSLGAFVSESPMGWITFMTMFYVGFYNSTGFAKWWKLRDLMGTVMVGHRQMGSRICSTFDKKQEREELKRMLKVMLYANTTSIRPKDVEVKDWVMRCQCVTKEEKSIIEQTKSPHAVIASRFVRIALGFLDADDRTALQNTRYIAGYTLELGRDSLITATEDLSMHMTQTLPKVYHPITRLLVYTSLILTPITLAVSHPTTAPLLSFLHTLFLYGTFSYVRAYLFSPFRHGETGGPTSPDTFDVSSFIKRTVVDIDEIFKYAPCGEPSKGKKKGGKEKAA